MFSGHNKYGGRNLVMHCSRMAPRGNGPATKRIFVTVAVTRAVSAALHTTQLGGHAVTGGPKFSPVTTLHPRESFDPPNLNVKH